MYDESPVDVILNKIKVVQTFNEDGIMDSIKYMLCHINCITPYSISRTLSDFSLVRSSPTVQLLFQCCDTSLFYPPGPVIRSICPFYCTNL